MARFVRLGDRAVLSVSGSDAGGFLQGLITNDVEKPRDGAAIHAALLTPQGKYLFDFLVYRRGDAFRLDCEAEARPALAKRIAMYKLRADVAIDGAIPDTVYAVFGDDAEEAARRIEGADVFPRSASPRAGLAHRGRIRRRHAEARGGSKTRRARNTRRCASRTAYRTGGATSCRGSPSCWRTDSTS